MSVEVDALLRVRKVMEGEIEELRNILAGKTKALVSLNSTIDLLRGWTGEEMLEAKVRPVREQRTYNTEAIREKVVDILTDARKALSVKEICEVLEGEGLVPSYCPAVYQKVRDVIKSVEGVKSKEVKGETEKLRWYVGEVENG